jgi:hypothetical protein
MAGEQKTVAVAGILPRVLTTPSPIVEKRWRQQVGSMKAILFLFVGAAIVTGCQSTNEKVYFTGNNEASSPYVTTIRTAESGEIINDPAGAQPDPNEDARPLRHHNPK